MPGQRRCPEREAPHRQSAETGECHKVMLLWAKLSKPAPACRGPSPAVPPEDPSPASTEVDPGTMLAGLGKREGPVAREPRQGVGMALWSQGCGSEGFEG